MVVVEGKGRNCSISPQIYNHTSFFSLQNYDRTSSFSLQNYFLLICKHSIQTLKSILPPPPLAYYTPSSTWIESSFKTNVKLRQTNSFISFFMPPSWEACYLFYPCTQSGFSSLPPVPAARERLGVQRQLLTKQTVFKQF